MLILAKAMMAIMLGFISAIVCGLIIIPLLKKLHVGQVVSTTLNERHLKKQGIPTMGGLIFILPIILIAGIFINCFFVVCIFRFYRWFYASKIQK